MTIIVGVTYPDGLVMASDLLAIPANGDHTEERKIDYIDRLIWGLAGKFDSRISVAISRKIKELSEKITIEDLIGSTLGDIISDVNDKIGAAYQNEALFLKTGIWGLFGALYEEEFGLWYCDGRRLVRKNKNVVVISPTIRGFEAQFRAANYEETRYLALDIIKELTSLNPEMSSGLSAFHMSRRGVESISYEPIPH